MTEYAEYYVFIPCGFPPNMIKADLVHVNTMAIFQMTKDIELSPRFTSIKEKDEWMTPENIDKLNTNLLSFIDKSAKNGQDFNSTIVQLMQVPHTDSKGFSMSEIVLDLLGQSDFKNDISDILETTNFKYDIPEDIKFEVRGVVYPDKTQKAKVINLADYRK